MSLASMMNQVCTISKPVRTNDGSGTQSVSWQVVYSGKRCYSEHASNMMWTANGRMAGIAKHNLFLDKSQKVSTGWRVQVDGEDQSYTISHVDEFHKHHLECEMQLLESPQTGGGQ